MNPWPDILVFIGNFWLILIISKLVWIAFMFGEDILRFSEALFAKISGQNSSESSFLPSRRKFIGQTALILSALPFVALNYGILKGRFNFRVHQKTIYFPDLPESFDGFTITQFSDFHAGSFKKTKEVLEGIKTMEELKSDVLVFTGDLVNVFASEFDEWVEEFSKINAAYGKYSILGNHDYGHYHKWDNEKDLENNFERLLDHHAKAGFKLLRDDAIKIEKDKQYIQILGVENWGMGFGKRGDLDKSLRDVDPSSFKILLSHDPSHWEYIVRDHATPIHLTLSGHTHGMQMGIEIPGFKWSPVQYRYPKWADLYMEKNKYLYVNRGFGVLGFRGRVGIWPEITQIVLKKGHDPLMG